MDFFAAHYILLEPDEEEEEAYDQQIEDMNDDELANDPMWVPKEADDSNPEHLVKHTKTSLEEHW